uniref:Zinc finger CCCH domain-containing protein 3 n=1 Tax=Scophthalmus maximus TaxID=52904 RepID=A0A8D3CT53_SCOMX
MAEREALKRQIDLLQDLINKHKSVHGDAPFPTAEPTQLQAPASVRGRGHGTSFVHSYGSGGGGRVYVPPTRGSWRKKHSLRNKTAQTSFEHHSASTSSSSVEQSYSLPSHSRGEEGGGRTRSDPSLSGIAQQKKDGRGSSTTGIGKDATKKPSTDVLRQSQSSRQTQEFQPKAASGKVALPGKMADVSLVVPPFVDTTTSLSGSVVQIKPSLISRTSTESKWTPVAPKTGNITLPASALTKVEKNQQPSPNLASQTSQTQISESYLKKSKFTWIKSQNVGGQAPGKAVSVSAASVSKAGSPSITSSRRTPTKKLPRKLSPVTVAPKTSKYKWVSAAGAQTKTSRKPPSPKGLTLPHRAPEKGEATRRLRSPAAPSAKTRRATGSSLSSRYRWKAAGQSSPGGGAAAATAAGASALTARRRSAFHWTAERSGRGVRGGLVVNPSLPHRASLPPSSPAGFKLRSRMKIIRKSPNSGGGSSPSAGKFFPRGRVHAATRTPPGVRRTPSRELVSFGRHKLRRLSPLTSTRTSPAYASASSHCSPASQRVFRTRYKMVTRPGSSAAHQTLHYNPALSWRAKRIQSARSFLQSRLRSPHHHDRHPASTQHWRGSGMCWIGGSLYRVSANKLSRTAASNVSVGRTGRFSGPHTSPVSPAWSRHSSTRHLASRAVQRSLAIIRHAHQKKQQKQYCMYYNRFGKCNRGNSCPFIHDPDKVAVCTRFLRGTCKRADGTCPFSHKVAKEKMPVCSYFLRGICNNSDCPYSHVYVSRKAEVCQDFVRGYCPEGEKCKKKHTLVCPDFSKSGSCPRGTRCKLQHRQQHAKRGASGAPTPTPTSTSTTAPAKRARTSKRPCLSVVMPDAPQAAAGTPAPGPLALPSFISLSSSPEEPDAPDTLPAEASQVRGKQKTQNPPVER